jgi:hypothetical protein
VFLTEKIYTSIYINSKCLSIPKIRECQRHPQNRDERRSEFTCHHGFEDTYEHTKELDKKPQILYSAINPQQKREDHELDTAQIFDVFWMGLPGPNGFKKKTH